jgi:alpha-glucosidase
MARRKDNTWFIGAMTNSEARTLTIDLDFIGEGKWEIHYFKDAKDSDVHAEKLEMGSAKVTHENELTISMAPGGGYAAYIVKK